MKRIKLAKIASGQENRKAPERGKEKKEKQRSVGKDPSVWNTIKKRYKLKQ